MLQAYTPSTGKYVTSLCQNRVANHLSMISLWTHEGNCFAFSLHMILPKRICASLMCQYCATNPVFSPISRQSSNLSQKFICHFLIFVLMTRKFYSLFLFFLIYHEDLCLVRVDSSALEWKENSQSQYCGCVHLCKSICLCDSLIVPIVLTLMYSPVKGLCVT